MRVYARSTIALLVCSLICISSRAWADDDDDGEAQGVYAKDDWPLATIQRPLTLAAGMLEIRGDTLRVGLSSNDNVSVGDPVVIAPDLFYGIDEKFTVGVVHHFGLLQPAGFCISGDLCGKTYNAIGLEAQYSLMRGGNFQVAGRGGLSFPQFSDDFVGGLTLGLSTRIRGGSIALLIEPTLYVGAINRDLAPDVLFLPVALQYQLNGQTMVYLSSGVNGPLDGDVGFGDSYQIPAGLGANFAVNNRLDFGAEFNFANVAGKDNLVYSKGEERSFIARMALRL